MAAVEPEQDPGSPSSDTTQSDFTAPPLEAPEDVARLLVDWHAQFQRDLPWRLTPAGARNPYTVLISEIMLQQTRVEVVRDYYLRWLQTFPTLEALAAADIGEVLKQWEGLGYYARARNLHRTAQAIVRDHGGDFPRTREGMLALPGIGPYTAGAILSLAFGQSEPLLDGNVARVLARLAEVDTPIDTTPTRKLLWGLARQLVHAAPAGEAGALNEALMELGATICVPRAPRCLLCPVAAHCRALRSGRQESLPVRTPKRATPHYDVAAGVIWQGDVGRSRLLIAQRPAEGLLGGLWEFPGGKAEPEDAGLRATLQREIREELAIEIEVGDEVAEVAHAFTHFRITLHAFHARHLSGEPQAIGCAAFRWIEVAELSTFAMGVVDRRIASLLVESSG